MDVKRRDVFSRLWLGVQILFIMAWMANLAGTDALYSIYALCGMGCCFCLCDNWRHRRFRPEGSVVGCAAMAALFSLATYGANYPLFTTIRDTAVMAYSTSVFLNILNTLCSLIGGWIVAWNVLVCLLARFPVAVAAGERKHSGRVFLLAFASILLINCVYLFLDEYPGHVTPDSLSQVEQGYENAYVNDHPFWHTYAIKVVLSLGYGLLGTPNGAVAFFSLCQMVMMAACFSLALMTLYQAGVPVWCVGAAWAVYALMPYNIAYSITMWKDVPFGASALVIAVALLRLLRGLGRKRWVNYLLLALGGMGLCLSRNNGLLALGGSTVVFLPALWKRDRRVLAILLAVLVVCALLTGPVLTALGVGETDLVEALSLPLQQLARVVAEGKALTQEEYAQLERIFDMEQMPDIYTDWLADPVKIEVRENDDEYLKAHPEEYLRLWLRLGLKYPGEYAKAWIQQTRGYWNGGYDYHQYAEMMEENDFGFAKTSGNNIIAKLIYLYFGFGRNSVFFQPLQAIGLNVWLLAVCCFVNARKKRPEWMLSVPALVIVCSLLAATPVFAEFRYAYSVFVTCPLLLPVTLYREA